MNLAELDKRVSAIELRNQKVEVDKAWETSFTRKLLLILFTYVSIGLYMWVIKINQPWINAVIPTLGFLLSTLTLPYFKNLWPTNQRNKQ